MGDTFGISLAQAGAGQAAGNFINEGMGLLFAGPKRKAQMKTARQMQDLQMKGQKEMTDFNMKKQLEMWEATGYGAQVDQMKRAGINPALLYGMGSGGGQTSNVDSGTVGSQHASEPTASHGTEGMGLMIGQMGLLNAQRKNIEADTKLKEVEAAKKSGVDTDEAKQRIANMALDLEFQKETFYDRIDKINSEAALLIKEIDLKEGAIARERGTRIADIQKAQAQAIGEQIKNSLMEAQKKATDKSVEVMAKEIDKMNAEITMFAEQISQGWSNLDRQERELQLKRWVEGIKAKYPGIMQVGGRILNETANAIGEILGMGSQDSHNPPSTEKK